MSLRRATITSLRAQVSAVGGRVFQAFFAPAATPPPYITVKRATRQGKVFGLQPVEIYIYAAQTSFVILDVLEQTVIRVLHRKEIVDVETGLRYSLEYAGSAGDAVDVERKLINRVVTFTVASVVI